MDSRTKIPDFLKGANMVKLNKTFISYIVLMFCIFLPTISFVPFPQQDTPLVIKEVLTQTSATYLGISPIIHVSFLILLILLYRYGQKMGKIVNAYFAILFIFFAFSQHIAETQNYGLVVITGNLAIIFVLGLFWMWEVYNPKNVYVFKRLSLWRYWVVPLAVLAFWFPVNADLTPNLSPLLLITSSFGVAFCPTAPVTIAILTLIYPKVNKHLLRITSFGGLIIGLFNVLSLFTMPGYTLWMFVLHTPLVFISLYGLLLPNLRIEPRAGFEPATYSCLVVFERYKDAWPRWRQPSRRHCYVIAP